MTRLPLLLLAASGAFAQALSVGVRAGVPMTDLFDAGRSGNLSYLANTHRYTFGPTIEVRLPLGVGFGLDILYKRLGYQAVSGNQSVDTTGNSWEFPLWFKYRFSAPIARPFVSGGVAFHSLQGLRQFVAGGLARSPAELRSTSNKGFVLGAGLDMKVGKKVHVTPELRYTRWGSDTFLDALNVFRSARNQGDFLLGVTF